MIDPVLQTISDSSPDGIVLISKDGQVAYINPAFSEMTGISAGELCGAPVHTLTQHLNNLANPKDQPKTVDITTVDQINTLTTGRAKNNVLTYMTRVITGNDGEQWGRAIYFHDTTNCMKNQQQARSEALAIAAHKLRTPLVGILGFSELLLKRKFDDDKRNEVIETIYRQASSFKKILDDYMCLERLDANQGEDFQFTKTTLQAVVEQLITDTKSHNKDVNLILNSVDSWPQVSIDVDRISQALTHLVSNAINYSPDGSTIVCDCVQRSQEHEHQFGISISDQGCGMSPDELDRVGQRFYRVDDSAAIPGGGLGIALVRAILTIHQGALELDSNKNKGTMATIWLPVL